MSNRSGMDIVGDASSAPHSVHRMARRVLATGLVLLPFLLLAGCGGGSGNNANIRMLNVSQNYTSLDVYLGSSTTTATLAGEATGTLSSYATVAAGSNTVYFTEDGYTQSDALASETETFSSGEYRTYVAYDNNAGEFAEYEINENQSTPRSGYASVEVLNAASGAGSLDVYLTSSGASLTGTSPNFSNLAVGSATSFSAIASGTYELSVTGTGNAADVRLQISSLTLSSQEVVTIILTQSAGGYLVNADLLPQRGSLTTELNPDARVRAVVGLASGSDVSATIGSTTLLSNAPITSIGTYQLVPVASESATVSVNGVSVSSPLENLTEGQDYTLLIYQSSGSLAESWLIDENALTPSGEASIRLVDAMSGLTDPLSFSVNDVPLDTGVAQGAASAYNTGVDAGVSDLLSVTDTTTSQQIYSLSSVTLSSEHVYTLFMFGSAASPTGILNRDR